MNKIERHEYNLATSASERESYKLTLSETRMNTTFPDRYELPYCFRLYQNDGRGLATRCANLWRSRPGPLVGYWHSRFKPSVTALSLLDIIAFDDPDREGVAETDYTCTNEGQHIQVAQDRVNYLITHGYLKRSHPFIDLTEKGRELAAERAMRPKVGAALCDFCGSPKDDLRDDPGGGLCYSCARHFAEIDDDDLDDERFDYDPTLDEYDDPEYGGPDDE